MAMAYEKLGDQKSALTFYKLHALLTDSVLNEEQTRKLIHLEDHYEFQKELDSIQHERVRERMVLEKELAETKFYSFTSIVGLIVSVIVLGLGYLYYRSKKKLHQEVMELNHRLKEVNDEKDLLVSMVAHDLKSPLHQIEALIILVMGMEKGLSDDTMQYLNMMTESVERLKDLISRVLDISAIESQDLNLDLKAVDMTTLLQEVGTEFKVTAAEKQISITASPSPKASILADQIYLRQVFENLVSNAVKYSPQSTTITIGVSSSPGRHLAYVKDQGPGITKSDQKKLFSKFTQLSSKPTADEGSTGLGLAIVKKYIDSMAGEIWVESDEGKGAKFIVAFKKS